MLAFLTEKSRTSCNFLQQSLTTQVRNLGLKSSPSESLKRQENPCRRIDIKSLGC
jgi:hypothetical protein